MTLVDTRRGDALVTVDDVARRLGCSRRTVFRLLADRALPSIKVGRQRLVDPDDVDAYLQQLRAASTAT